MTRIKICGLKRPQDIDYANELLPDYVGFVFYEKSKRYVDITRAEQLKGRLDNRIKSVAVFLNETPEKMIQIGKSNAVDYIQIHGRISDEDIINIRRSTGKPVIQAFKIESGQDIMAAEKTVADFVLLDNGAGGTGENFDWSLLKNFSGNYFLAGGLNPDNVVKAINMYEPFAVDVSSGVETDDYKDFNKMKRFVENVRG